MAIVNKDNGWQEIAKNEQKLFKANKSGHARAHGTSFLNTGRADSNKIINRAGNFRA